MAQQGKPEIRVTDNGNVLINGKFFDTIENVLKDEGIALCNRLEYGYQVKHQEAGRLVVELLARQYS